MRVEREEREDYPQGPEWYSQRLSTEEGTMDSDVDKIRKEQEASSSRRSCSQWTLGVTKGQCEG